MNKLIEASKLRNELDKRAGKYYKEYLCDRWVSAIPIVGVVLFHIDTKLIKLALKIAYAEGMRHGLEYRSAFSKKRVKA